MQDLAIKRCSKCGLTKQLSEFAKDRSQVDGHTRWCKSCKSQKYYENHDSNLERQSKWYRENKTLSIETTARWKQQHPERAADIRRRASRKYYATHRLTEIQRQQQRLSGFADTATLTPEEWIEQLETFNHRCAYCHTPATLLEQEHVMPLSRGGAYSQDNIVPACSACNLRKGKQTALEFLAKENGCPLLPQVT